MIFWRIKAPSCSLACIFVFSSDSKLRNLAKRDPKSQIPTLKKTRLVFQLSITSIPCCRDSLDDTISVDSFMISIEIMFAFHYDYNVN